MGADSPRDFARRRRLAETVAAGGLAGPAFLLLLALFFLPTLGVFVIAVTDWRFGAATLSFVGTENFVETFADPVFRTSLLNTILYVCIVVPATLFISCRTWRPCRPWRLPGKRCFIRPSASSISP